MVARDFLSSGLLPRILNFLVPQPKAHWTHELARLEFRSGLGDSAWLLYGIVRSLKPAIAVEIGSARGKSACFVGMALKENGTGRLYAIDPHTRTEWNDIESVDTYDIMRKHLEKLELTDVVTIVREHSASLSTDVPSPIDLLFIDGDHSYEGVRTDWMTFAPRMRASGLVVFHDTTWELERNSLYRSDMGVPRFVEELRRKGYPIITVERDFGVSIVQPVQGGNSVIPREDHHTAATPQ
jgi:predicted O-methyltransferase YrrM